MSPSAHPDAPIIIFGTANFGSPEDSKGKLFGPVTVEQGREYLDVLQEFNVDVLDTARIYSGGESEKLLGALDASREFKMCTKASGTLDGCGTRDAVLSAFKASSEALGVKEVDTYYLHTPDRTTSLEETMDTINELHKAGSFKTFGISNLRADEVQHLHTYARSKNYILPTIYQGTYNLLSRQCETKLLPLLRTLGIRFYAYSPLCCGLLINAEAKLQASTGRWDTSHFGGKFMNALYNKPSYIAASNAFQDMCGKYGVRPAGAAYRWVRYHSELEGGLGDGMVVGASSARQLEESLGEIEKGPLEEGLVGELEGLWDLVKEDAPAYSL
ncbi:hypothetical protein IAQ61_007459 [Plenodomus lingam]|uniref:Oxidoreductase sirO n=2 Tax=Leptosphaeria maculans TaxID=5022 RepID=SIRO_LEPMC|nr:similar to aflatoxin B1 aldehyde reductase member 2 [Plenodomus lingam JN3]Q6Q875.1 RecName: Full=Oxidoreductase sirO; AltName: Full=Sirodesmin biosynthesis protein O [Plenodomus lingam]AAS92553.1 SirO [Plenodomus lingam]KAH9866870.1 hypothetical protein IAQ61_007459 [Plenodomus lingam]CBX98933.1 similar to aflatoxin B1 aldehyde reductase member 2 [Plenodomus lingam JN3]